MRFLLDECCPRGLALALRQRGHDVVHVVDFARGAIDRDLASQADSEDRLIVTEDFDFGELAVRYATPATGVVIVFCEGLGPAGAIARAVEAIDDQGESLRGHLTIIETKRMRRRRL